MKAVFPAQAGADRVFVWGPAGRSGWRWTAPSPAPL